METQTKKQHREFDLSLAQKTYDKVDEELSGETITSPFDLYAVEKLRDDHQLRTGAASPTDVFVFGKGTSEAPYLTKFSGVPYWPAKREWPKDGAGNPLQFLAQINFSDSSDIASELPGDLLLVFLPACEDWMWEPERIHLEWVVTTKEPLIKKLPTGVKPYAKSEWYGVIHRTLDYPDTFEKVRALEVDQARLLPVLSGTKIGGALPEFLQSPPVGINPMTGRPMRAPKKKAKDNRSVLCQLGSIQAHPEVAYPWTNQKKPLSLEFKSTGIYDEENQIALGDMGSIYILREGKDKFTARFKS